MISRTRAATEADARNCKRMYYLGFAFLPFLWLVNYIYYKHTLPLANTPSNMKSHIRYSLAGFIISLILWTLWLIIFYADEKYSWAKSLMIFDPSIWK